MDDALQKFITLERETRFYIVRHGESTANLERRIQGHSDYPLSENGRLQAASAGSWFRSRNIARVYSSPLSRARETAGILASAASLPEPQILPELIELDTGKFSGLTVEETKQRYPLEAERFSYMSWASVADAEQPEALYSRALSVWERLIGEANKCSGDLLAVSHGGLIQWLVRVTFGGTQWFPLLTTGNCNLFLLHAVPSVRGKLPFLQWVYINHIIADTEEQVPPVF